MTYVLVEPADHPHTEKTHINLTNTNCNSFDGTLYGKQTTFKPDRRSLVNLNKMKLA